MRLTGLASCAALAVVLLSGGHAVANTCQAGGLTCSTGMPIDGYCECTAHGVTKDGTVVGGSMKPMHGTHKPNCTANPQAAGCPHQ